MAQNQFDEVIRLQVEAGASSGLAALSNQISNLEGISDESRLALQALVGELAQNQNLTTAAEKFDQLKQQITEASLAAEQSTARFEAATQAAAGDSAQYEQKKQALIAAKAALEDYRASTDATAEGERELRQAVREATAEQAQAKAAYSASNTELKEADRLYTRNAATLRGLTTQASAFENQLREAGVSTDSLASAQAQLAQRADSVQAALTRETAAARLAEQQARELAAETQRAAQAQAQYDAALARTAAAQRTAAQQQTGLNAAGNDGVGIFGRLKGVLAGAFAFVGIGAVVQGLRKVIEDGNEAEKSLKQLDAVLTSTGRSAEFSAEALALMADTLEKKTQFTAESLIAAQTQLLQFANIAATEFPDALQLSADAAERMGTSVEDASFKIGKALQDPQASFGLLKKMGADLSLAQQQLVKDFTNVNDIAGAQRVILDQLKVSLGGAAEAASVNTLVGLWKRLGDAVGDFAQDVLDMGAFEYIKNQVKLLNATIAEAAADGRLKQWAQDINEGFQRVGEALKGTIVFIKDHTTAIIALAQAYTFLKIAQAATSMLSFANASGAASGAVRGLTTLITAIPAVRIAVIGVGAIIAASENMEYLSEKIFKQTDEYAYLQETIKKYNLEIAATGERQRALAESLNEYADVQIKSAEAVAQMTETERTAYAERRAGLEQYLRARVEEYDNAKKLNQLNAEGLAYFEKIKVQLKDTQNAYGEYNKAVSLANESVSKGLSVSALLLVKNLGDITGSATEAKKSIASLFEGAEDFTTQKFADLALALQYVGEQSDLAGSRVRDTLGVELKKLSAGELQKFQFSAETAFEQTGRSAKEAALVLESILGVAMENLGTDAVRSGEQITRAGADIIKNFQTVAESSVASSRQISASFAAALSGLETKGEIEALKANFESLGAQGKLSAKDVSIGMLEVNQRLRDVSALMDPLSDQFQKFGLTSQQAMDNAALSSKEFYDQVVAGSKTGAYAQEDALRAFKVYADAARQATADSDDATRAQTERTIEQAAAADGLTQRLIETGVLVEDTTRRMGDGLFHAAAGMDSLSQSLIDVEDRLGTLAESGTASVGDLVYELNKAGLEYEDLGEKGKDAYDKIAQAAADSRSNLAAGIGSAYADWYNYFAAISEEAVKQYKYLSRAAALGAADVGEYFRMLGSGSKALSEKIAAQQEAAEKFIQTAGEGTAQTAAEVEYLLRQLESAKNALNLLDQGRADALDDAIGKVADKLDRIVEKARSAREELGDIADGLQEQLLEQDGQLEELENRRYARQIAQLRERAEAAGVLNSAEFKEAMAAAEELHKRKMEDIKTEAAAEADKQKAAKAAAQATAAAAEASAAQTTQSANQAAQAAEQAKAAAAATVAANKSNQGTGTGAGSSSGSGSSNTSASGNVTRSVVDLNIKLDGKDLGTGIDPNNQTQIDALVRKMTPKIVELIKNEARNSGR